METELKTLPDLGQPEKKRMQTLKSHLVDVRVGTVHSAGLRFDLIIRYFSIGFEEELKVL